MKHILLLWFFSCVAGAQTKSYLPLETGNHWVYRVTSGRINAPLTIDVGPKQLFGGRVYFQITGLVPNLEGETVFVRYDRDGKLVRYRDGQDLLLVDFEAPAKSTYTSYMLTQCPATATLKTRRADYEGPAGKFDAGVEIAYQWGGCPDAGFEQEVFLPRIGLVHRVSETVAGPAVFDLVYAHIGGRVIASPAVSFSLEVDQPVYHLTGASNPVSLDARIDLRNSTDVPVPLEFATTEDYDLLIRDGNGTVVYQWSQGKTFRPGNRQVKFIGEQNWLVSVPLAATSLAPGFYTAQAILSTSSEKTRSSATVTFTVE